PEVIAMDREEELAGEPGEDAGGAEQPAGKPFRELPAEPLTELPGEEFPRDQIPEILGDAGPQPGTGPGSSPEPPPSGTSGDEVPAPPRTAPTVFGRLPESYPREPVTAKADRVEEQTGPGHPEREPEEPITEEIEPAEAEPAESVTEEIEPAEAEPAKAVPDGTGPAEIKAPEEAEPADRRPDEAAAADRGPDEAVVSDRETGENGPPPADSAPGAPVEEGEPVAESRELTVILAPAAPPGDTAEAVPEAGPGGAAGEQVSTAVRAVEALGGKIVFKEYRGPAGGPAVVDALIPGSGYRMLIHELERLGRVVLPPGDVPEARQEQSDPQQELQVRIRFVTGGGAEAE
ncbi:MAG: hypothetical protein ACOC8N_07545, partial [Spirochaetota bacterium]